MNTIVIDDEKNGAEALQLLLKQNCSQVNIVAVAHSPKKAQTAF